MDPPFSTEHPSDDELPTADELMSWCVASPPTKKHKADAKRQAKKEMREERQRAAQKEKEEKEEKKAAEREERAKLEREKQARREAREKHRAERRQRVIEGICKRHANEKRKVERKAEEAQAKFELMKAQNRTGVVRVYKDDGTCSLRISLGKPPSEKRERPGDMGEGVGGVFFGRGGKVILPLAKKADGVVINFAQCGGRRGTRNHGATLRDGLPQTEGAAGSASKHPFVVLNPRYNDHGPYPVPLQANVLFRSQNHRQEEAAATAAPQ